MRFLSCDCSMQQDEERIPRGAWEPVSLSLHWISNNSFWLWREGESEMQQLICTLVASCGWRRQIEDSWKKASTGWDVSKLNSLNDANSSPVSRGKSSDVFCTEAHHIFTPPLITDLLKWWKKCNTSCRWGNRMQVK